MSAEKTIDGLSVRQATVSRATKIQQKAKVNSPNLSAFKKVKKSNINLGEPDDPLKAKAQITTIEELAASEITIEATPEPTAPSRPQQTSKRQAHADFLKPVKSFDFDFSSDDLKLAKKSSKKSTKASPAEQSKLAKPQHMKKVNNPTPQKPKKPKKSKKPRKVISIILLALVLIIIGVVAAALIWGNDIIAKLTGNNSNIWSAIGAFASDTYVDLATDTNGRTNILIFGTGGYDMEGTVGNGQHDGSQLTDSIMVVGIDQNSGDTVMTSIPRDLKVPAACYAGKVNEVYTCNNQNGTDDKAGADALMSTVSEVLGINFQYYIHVNWGSLVQIVDALGGITVTLDEDINDYNYTGAVFKANTPYTIDGEQALGLARARHGTTGGDFTRGTSQQKIIIGIKDRIMQKLDEGSFDIGTAIGLVSTLGDNLRTNISIEEIKTGLHLVKDLDLNQMRQVMLYDYNDYSASLMKNATINDLSYVIPTAGVGNYSKIYARIAQEFSTNAIERENAAILLLNGSDTTGLAAAEGQTLESEGYNIAEIANAPTSDYTDRYTIYLLDEKASGTAQALHGELNTAVRTAAELPSDIDADGYAIVIILGASSHD